MKKRGEKVLAYTNVFTCTYSKIYRRTQLITILFVIYFVCNKQVNINWEVFQMKKKILSAVLSVALVASLLVG